MVGAVQDPRKEVLPLRDLFPVRIALRMTEADQADMVLGNGAHDRGARCERIPRALPGVGYVLVDGDPTPVRVRAGWLADDDIRTMAAHHTQPAAQPPTHRPATPPVRPAALPPTTAGQGWTPDLTAFPPPPVGRTRPGAPGSVQGGGKAGEEDDPTIPLRGWRSPPPPALPPAPPSIDADDGSPEAEAAWRAWEAHFPGEPG
ncbi:hypothetical protein CEDDRAFT_01602 [Frankia sp. CeD]|nr:hypothetical protein CEDDRAFT_01602 [Frankia sp. CeD]